MKYFNLILNVINPTSQLENTINLGNQNVTLETKANHLEWRTSVHSSWVLTDPVSPAGGDGEEVQLCLESLPIWHSSPQKRSKFSVIHTVYMSAGLGFSLRKHVHLVTCRLCRGALKEPRCCNKATVQGGKKNQYVKHWLCITGQSFSKVETSATTQKKWSHGRLSKLPPSSWRDLLWLLSNLLCSFLALLPAAFYQLEWHDPSSLPAGTAACLNP